ncbi:MAG: hypothetical protein ACPGLY_26850, partial [Rubripirellula sp.]
HSSQETSLAPDCPRLPPIAPDCLVQLALSSQIRLVYTICTATRGSGVRTGMPPIQAALSR